MTMKIFKTTSGNTLTPLGFQLKQRDEDGTLTAVNLAGKTVKFKMVSDDGDESKNVPETTTGVTITDTTNGEGYYDFQVAHTAGIYWGWFIVYSGAEYDTFPVGRELMIIFEENEDCGTGT